MTMDEDINPQQRFVASKLPWVIGIVGLVVYLVTLNHWLSFSSISQVAKVSGWTWQPAEWGLLGLALAVGLAAALLPAWRAYRADVAPVLAEG